MPCCGAQEQLLAVRAELGALRMARHRVMRAPGAHLAGAALLLAAAWLAVIPWLAYPVAARAAALQAASAAATSAGAALLCVCDSLRVALSALVPLVGVAAANIAAWTQLGVSSSANFCFGVLLAYAAASSIRGARREIDCCVAYASDVGLKWTWWCA